MKLAAGIEYKGTNYAGWQFQSHAPSIQQQLQQALQALTHTPITCYCSGRTDAGVHATQQIVHFEVHRMYPASAWLQKVNHLLPPDIRILWVQPVPSDFDARFCAQKRMYQYVLQTGAQPAPLLQGIAGYSMYSVQLEPMQHAASLVTGTHDFSAFRSAHCQSQQPVRTLYSLSITQLPSVHGADSLYVFTYEANGFLHNMIRILTGSLITVGSGKQPAHWLKDTLQSLDRTQAGITAPPQGLYYCGALYDPKYQLPAFKTLPC
jgi:tRNA pseudouridine38-40 synthase